MASPPRKIALSDWSKVIRDAAIVAIAALLTWGLEVLLPEVEEEKLLPAAAVTLIVTVLSAVRRYMVDTRPEGG